MGKPAPRFWWDFIGEDCNVVVQSDYPGGESLAVFSAPGGIENRAAQIEQAEKLIEDFRAGRKTPCWGRRLKN